MKKQINFKGMFVLVLGVVAIAATIHYVHAAQVKRTAGGAVRGSKTAGARR